MPEYTISSRLRSSVVSYISLSWLNMNSKLQQPMNTDHAIMQLPSQYVFFHIKNSLGNYNGGKLDDQSHEHNNFPALLHLTYYDAAFSLTLWTMSLYLAIQIKDLLPGAYKHHEAVRRSV